MNSMILVTGTRYLIWMLLLFSFFMLLRGHNEPGGGFIGGLLGATGFVLFSLACGPEAARKQLYFNPEAIAMVGLGVALGAGLAAALFADAFFTGQWLFLGGSETEKGFPLSTVLVFDIGVYLVVMGSVMSLVFALEEEG
ncbi:MAG: MnhB domain-containing protein [Pseudomonadota bacterium]